MDASRHLSSALEAVKMPAVRVSGRVFEGSDHQDAYFHASRDVDLTAPMAVLEEGFTTTQGRFVSRVEAFHIARSLVKVPRRKSAARPFRTEGLAFPAESAAA